MSRRELTGSYWELAGIVARLLYFGACLVFFTLACLSDNYSMAIFWGVLLILDAIRDPQLRWGELSTRWADGDDDECWFMPSQVTDVRPLVVIDPEDREQIERLRADLIDSGWIPQGDADALGDILREFANPTPPRPDEPTGLYARIEDADGRVWVRTALQASVWRRESVNSGGLRYLIPQDGCEGYADIPAVRVLSEGVTP